MRAGSMEERRIVNDRRNTSVQKGANRKLERSCSILKCAVADSEKDEGKRQQTADLALYNIEQQQSAAQQQQQTSNSNSIYVGNTTSFQNECDVMCITTQARALLHQARQHNKIYIRGNKVAREGDD